MTRDEFANSVRQLCLRYGGSVTSWGRTTARTLRVGGFAGDPHTHWYGADVVWDDPNVFHDGIVAKDFGLTAIIERDHTHIQPLGYPPGPLTLDQVQAWENR